MMRMRHDRWDTSAMIGISVFSYNCKVDRNYMLGQDPIFRGINHICSKTTFQVIK